MRNDEYLNGLTLERHQKFFLEAWYNMTLETSLDSHRVKCMNSLNIVKELLEIMSKTHASMEEDIARIRKEAIFILKTDPLLETEKWKKDTKTFLELLIASEGKDANKDKSVLTLIKYYGRDYENKLNEEYLPDIIDELKRILNLPDDGTTLLNQVIYDHTNNLLSCLIDSGFSIEALFAVYNEVLVPRVNDKRSFTNKLEFACRLISNVDKEYKIFLRLEGVKRAEAIPTQIGNVELFLNSALPIEANNGDPRVKKFFTPGQGRAFASVEVIAKDLRSGGSLAHENISSLIDLIRFEFESSVIKVDETFVGIESQKNPRVSKIPSKVPNPKRNIDQKGLGEFISSVSTILLSQNLAEEGRERIKSTFRLYRSGLDSTSFEQKVVNWWTALEYLIRGSTSNGKIGEAVIDYLTPILCLDYLSKHVDNYKRTFVAVKESEKTENKLFPNLKEIPLTEIYELMKDPAKRADLVTYLEVSPLITFKLERFGKSLENTNSILKMLDEHEEKVTWHIQRIYRARCDIVHSAERILNSSLLCANLEFYLKSLLASLLEEFAKTQSLTGPKEFLDRSKYQYSKLKESLTKGDDSLIKSSLHTGIW